MDERIIVRPVNTEDPIEKKSVEDVIAKSFPVSPPTGGGKISENAKQLPGFFNQFNYLPMEQKNYFWGVFLKRSGNEEMPVAGMMAAPFILSIDGLSLKALGLTGVATHPDYRHRGYAAEMLGEFHRFAEAHGYDAVILHSDADLLYRKQGYEFAFIDIIGRIKSGDIREVPKKLDDIILSSKIERSAYRIVGISPDEFTAGGLPFSAQIPRALHTIWKKSNENTEKRLKCERSLYYFAGKMLEHIDNPMKSLFIMIRDNIESTSGAMGNQYGADDVLAYSLVRFIRDKSALSFIDLYHKSLTYGELAYFISKILDRYPLEQIEILEFYTFDENGLLNGLIERLGASLDVNLLPKNMAKILDFANILIKLQPIFSKRIADDPKSCGILSEIFNDPDKDYPVIFKMNIVPAGTYYISISRSEVSVSDNPPDFQELDNDASDIAEISPTIHEMTALLFGYMPADEIEPEGLENLSEDYKHLFLTLFPCLNPVWDRFCEY